MVNGNRTIKTAAVVLPFVALAAVAACGSSDGGSDNGAAGTGSGTGGSAGAAPTGGSVTGTVSYSGTAQGDLIVAAFSDWPAAGPPDGFVTRTSPSFPQAYTLSGLSAGDYYIFAFLDVPPASPTMPGGEDIQSTPTETVHVSDSASATHDVTLPAD